MKINKIQETEIWQEYNTWLKAYLNADVKTYEAFLDDDYRFIGSTNNEEFLNRNDTTSFFERTGEQLAGITDLRNETRTLEAFGTSIFLTHLFDLWFLNNGDWTYYGRFRCSSIMQKKKEGWRFIYQHFSMPDSKSDEGETIGYDKVNAENIELKEAIKRRTIELESKNRELEVEAALERVRSASMAMHITSELRTVISAVFGQLKELNLPLDACYIDIFEPDNWGLNIWVGTETDTYPEKLTVSYLDHPLFDKMKHARLQHESFFTLKGDKESKNRFVSHLVSENDVAQERLDFMLQLDGLDMSVAISEHAALSVYNYRGIPYSEAQNEIIKRFSIVFQQAYTRFLDIQKAEAQAREAQIEAALERVRSRTMAMHSSQDVDMIVTTLFDELLKLGVDKSIRSGIGILDKSRRMEVWTASANPSGNTALDKGILDMGIHQLLIEVQEAWETKKTTNSYELVGDDLINYFKTINDAPEYSFQVDFEKLANKIIHYDFFFPEGALFAFSPTPLSNEISRVFMRFASVFGQTYRRYLDLQKAETQAREAQIEAALERIRSRAMAMQHSEELRDVALELRTQMGILGQKDLEVCAIHLYEEHKDHFESWAAMHLHGKEERLLQFQALFPKSGKLIIDEMMECYASDQNEYVLVNEGEKGRQWFELLREKAPEAFQYLMEATANIPAEQMKAYWGIADFSGGALVMVTYFYPDKDSRDLLRRTANVFGLAYKRFQDLRMAESSARAARRQASLDRIRADISSMRNAEDLNRITPLVFNELTALGIPFIRCGVFIVHEKEENVEIYLSTPEGKSLAVMTLPFSANEMTSKSVEAWKKEEVYIQHWNQTDFTNWGKSMQEQGYVKDLKTYQGTETAPESLHLHFVPFAQGLLYVGSPENLSEEQIDLVKAMAKAFSIAYARYEDFVKLEQAKAEVESAMSELKATQSQLVQQEKLASLGQLTAGIAHEIKNPLNFVNNFSEVSMEMIEEVLEARSERRDLRQSSGTEKSGGKHDESEEMEDEILEDIKANLKKIHEHGSRANGIVTSMLQHSRGGSGKKEPTDLNALIKEYVNLSFHGMRAGKNPINVDIGMDLDPDLGMVSLIKEDFTRVVINLCNNAFDAMKEKVKMYQVPSLPAGKAGTKYQEGVYSEVKYLPKLKVTTMLEKGQVRIAFEDNGPGIPDEIKDKILQPFFTTKKGTEGTGLGLSITHDIVKAHGGEINIESNKNEGSKFSILLDV